MEWMGRLMEEGIRSDGPEFSLVYHPALAPAAPPEYVVPGMVGLTFRLHRRPDGRHVFVTLLDLPAAVRLGARLGLGPALAVAFVDSHERLHVHLQLEGVPEEVEEDNSRFVDAVWLSLHHVTAERLVRAGAFGLVEEVGPDFWERLVDEAQEPGRDACAHARTRLLAQDASLPAPDAPPRECLDCGARLEADARDRQERARDAGPRKVRLVPREEAPGRAGRARQATRP